MADIEIYNEDDFEMEGDTDKGVEKLKENVRSRKGRGFGDKTKSNDKDKYESMYVETSEAKDGPQRSVEGWIVFVTNLHEEIQEDDIREKFENFGAITNIHLNMDRRTGYVKGYALVEFPTFKEADEAVKNLNGTEIGGMEVGVQWAFVQAPQKKEERDRRHDNRRARQSNDNRQRRTSNDRRR